MSEGTNLRTGLVSLIVAALLLVGCGSNGTKQSQSSMSYESSGTAITSSPVTEATVVPTSATPTTMAPTPAPTVSPKTGLAGVWYGAQADNLAPSCQGSTTYTFTSGGQFTAATIYNPNSLGNCVNYSVSGTFSVSGGTMTISGRPDSPVGQAFTVTTPYSQIDANTISIDSRLYHRS